MTNDALARAAQTAAEARQFRRGNRLARRSHLLRERERNGPAATRWIDMELDAIARELAGIDATPDPVAVLAAALRSIRAEALRTIKRRESPGGQHAGADRWGAMPLGVAIQLERDVRDALELAGVEVEP